MVALFGSILIQQFLMKAPFEQYAAEFICFFGMSLYIAIRYITAGLNIYGENKRAKAAPFVNSIVSATAITAINGVLNYTQYAQRYQRDGMGYFFAVLAITFISAAVLTFAVLALFGYISNKRQKCIQRRLDEAERDE